MINRCYNPKCKEYCRYGAKGVTIHSDWHDFQVFAEWFEANYQEGACLDKDLKGGKIYSAANCVFLTPQKNSEIAKSKHYDFISPTGEHVQVYNLQKFCRDNNLDPGGMRHVNSGKRQSHKGWRKTNPRVKLMKTVLKTNQLDLFAGSSVKQAKGTKPRAGIVRVRLASALKQQLKDEYTYPSGAIRAPLEFKLAYADFFALTPKGDRKALRELMEVSERTHYRWLADAREIQSGTASVRTHIRRG
ncbi:HNH endonuclease [Vibrio phage vB_VspP_pVa5]|uniref:HNH homing endonuclease protein n=1 Tax=Vibrio phage vB_VspP_pVa5 TaxID=1913109 RepID=A0A1J0GV43_9CAUD|nr:HNH endonuclease [Vibrio phage vB_VspP_pVa5]APC46046.1 HNH homing endonuclease protein [Vibrio phage vB_VspP_pVa5]